MGIDLTPNPDNRNLAADVPIASETRDHIMYEETDAIRWTFDNESKTFLILNLPFFFASAPENVRRDLIEWMRLFAEKHGLDMADRPPMPESVRAFRDDPRTERIRAQRKRGYISLEDYA